MEAAMKIDSELVHVGERKRLNADAIPSTTPIYLGTTYLYESAATLDSVMGHHREGHSYSRYSNPTNEALEQLMAMLEHGYGALATASGMAALAIALETALLDRPRSIVAARSIYGATISLLDQIFVTQGVEITYADACDLDAFTAAIEKSKPGCVFLESISNPLLRVARLDKIADAARAVGAAVVVDSTFATPLLMRPLDFGAHLVVHSATKYLGGHGDVLGGIVVSDEAHYAAMRSLARILGPSLGSFEAYLTLRGMKTLALRFRRQCENAKALAEWLRTHPKVERVYYCSDASHPDAEAIRALFAPGLFGAIVSFEIKGADKSKIFAFMDGLKMIVPGTSLGDVHTLLLYPLIASHRDVAPKMRERMGIRDNLVRVAAGIEDFEDIRSDLEKGLAGIQ